MDRLDKFEVLSEFSTDERGILADFLEEVVVADGMSVFQRGQESESLLLIHEGRVRLEHDGRPQGVLGMGQGLGGVGLVVIGRRPANAYADGDTRLLALSRERYLRMRDEQPVLALKLLEGLMQGVSGAARALAE